MKKTILKQRQYLGVGYCYQFENLKTGEVEYRPISEQAYYALTQKNGWTLNPRATKIKRFIGAFGGQPKLDTPNTLGEIGDCFFKDGKWFVYEIKEVIKGLEAETISEYTQEEFENKFICQ